MSVQGLAFELERVKRRDEIYLKCNIYQLISLELVYNACMRAYATFIKFGIVRALCSLPLIARAGSGAKYDYITHVHVQCAYHKFINISF